MTRQGRGVEMPFTFARAFADEGVPIMRRITIIATSLFFTLAAVTALCATLDVAVQIAPMKLLLGADQGGYVTVHAAIAYGLVDTDSLTLNGVPVDYTKSDNRGELVAKFPEVAVKDIVAPPCAELVLSGMTIDGESFSGADVVQVVDWPSLP